MLVCLSYSAKRTIAECIHDPVAYSQLNDSVIEHIRLVHNTVSQSEELSAAKGLIRRLEKRQLYKFIGQTGPLDAEKHSKLLNPVRTCTMLYLYFVHFMVCLHGYMCVCLLTCDYLSGDCVVFFFDVGCEGTCKTDILCWQM